MKRRIAWVIVGMCAVLLAAAAAWRYSAPTEVNETYEALLYANEHRFERKVDVSLTGKKETNFFTRSEIIGQLRVDKRTYDVKLRDDGEQYFAIIAERSANARLRTIGTATVTRDLETIWIRLDPINAEYGLKDGYIIGPAANRFEADDLLGRVIVRQATMPSIVEVAVSCSDLCMEREAKTYGGKTFRDASGIEPFAQAINRAAPRAGILNYAAEFAVKVTYSTGTVESYDLSIGRERGKRGLLVPRANSHQGYTIHEQDADRLRDIIYPSE